MSHKSRLVYSTDRGRICPECGHTPCQCKSAQAPEAGDGIVRIHRETKGRKGKGVSLVTGLPLAAPELSSLARQLKQACGCGGTVKNGVIEIQSEDRQRLARLLTEQGYVVKLAGG